MPPKKEKGPLFQPKDKVLAKMTGFPAWPSFVMPSEMIPATILKAKKKTTNTCVIFIPDGDFNWMNEKSLEALSPEKLQSKIDKIPKDKLKGKAKKKSGRTSNVAEALVAANGLQFDDFMEDLEKAKASFNEEDEDEDEDEEVEEGGESEDEEVDLERKEEKEGEEELEDESANPEESQKPVEKKKSPALPPRTNTGYATRGPGRARGRILRTARGTPTVESAGEESEEAIVNGTAEESENEDGNESMSDSLKQPANAHNEEASLQRKRAHSTRDEEVSANGEENEDSTKQESETEEPQLKKHARDARAVTPKLANDKDRQHQLWLCRIKLQRSLIQRNQPVTPKDPKSFPPPTVDELLMARIILQKLADFPVTVELLRDTKIHKVLKCIVKDDDLEYPESFRLHEKCKELLDKWQDLIESLKQGKSTSRIGGAALEDSEISGIRIKPAADKQNAAKVRV